MGLPHGTGNPLQVGSSGGLASTDIDTSAKIKAIVTDETGSGALVFANTPTLVTPILGTPQSGTLSTCTGLPISTGVSGLGTNVATFLGTPSSANLAAALTDETGSGAAVFATSPTLVTPVLGTPASGDLSNCTGITGLKSATINVSAAQIVGNSANQLQHANGIQLVAAVASKRLLFVQCMIRYDFVTAAYTGGGNTIVQSLNGATLLTVSGILSTAAWAAAATDRTAIIIAVANGAGGALTDHIGASLILINSNTTFANPGTAAGTCTITTYYYEVAD